MARIIGAGVLAGSLVLACSGSNSPPAHPRRSPAPESTASTATTTPRPKRTTPSGMAPAAYRRSLTAADGPVTRALAPIGSAVTLQVLLSRVTVAERVLNHAAVQLGQLRPPRAVTAAHARFVRAVRSFAEDVSSLHQAATGKQVCAGSSAMARLRGRNSPEALRAAAWALHGTGYESGLRLPVLPVQQTRRLGTGTFIQDARAGGPGQFQINNDGDVDAVVSLVTGGHPIFGVYVAAGSSYTVTSVPDGTYGAYFTTGLDWNSAARSFTRSCNFTKYDDPFPYQTTSTTAAVWSITLQKVIGGHATTTDLKPGEYPR